MFAHTLRLLVIGMLVVGLCGPAQGDDLRVGVYSGVGQKGVLNGLKGVEGIKAVPLNGFSVPDVSQCDVVIWQVGHLAAGDRMRFWEAVLKEHVNAGGGLILTHDAVGGYRHAMADDPLYRDIARIPGRQMRKENKRLLKRVGDAAHPLGKALPETVTHTYYDHMAFVVGPEAAVLMTDEDGDPVVVAAESGKGRVVLMGNLFGYEGTSRKDEKTGLYSRAEREAAPSGEELVLLVEAVKWAGAAAKGHPHREGALQAAVDAAVDRAAASRTTKKEPVRVFNARFREGKTLDKDTWEYEPDLATKRHWGFWHSFPISGGGYASRTHHANKVLSSRAFEKGPIHGPFVVTFDAILPDQPYECVGILDVALVNERESGYGVQLVFVLPDDPLDTKDTYRLNPSTGYKAGVSIKEAVNAITSFEEGEKKILALVEGDRTRLRRTGKGYERIPIRLERSSGGELILSMDGKVVAQARDGIHDDFTNLTAAMTTSNGRVAFDNPTVVGVFEEAEETYAPIPWIVPEPKEMVKNGESFALSDGAQFVVSDKKKIDTYLLDEWIIPEIEGRFGVKMKAVTIDEVDPSKPLIYLGEASDPAFESVFGPELKALDLEDPGPEGYGIVVTEGKAHAAGADERGTFYALQSLVQLMARKDARAHIRGVRIKDWPDFKMRAVQAFFWSAPSFEDKIENIKRHIRMLARYKANGWYLLEPYFDFPSYDLRRPGTRYTFKDMIETSKYAHKYHLEPMGGALGLSHPMLKRNLPRGNPKLWQWVLDHNVLSDPSLDPARRHADAMNPLSPEAWQMVKAVNEDIMDAIPEIKTLFIGMDEISPPLNTHAPDQSNDDLYVEWLARHHKLLADRGVRVAMYPDPLIGKDAAILAKGLPDPASSAAIDRIPKDIILVPWYYGDKPERPHYKYLKDKGFDVVAMCGPASYGDLYNSAYYAAKEGKKAGISGITRFAHHTGALTNPQRSVALPYIYGWTVPEDGQIRPAWNWQEHWQEVYQGPLPSHTGTVAPLDIAEACNESRLDETPDDGKGWLDFGKVADLRELAPGELSHGRYTFRVIDESVNDGKSVVVVRSGNDAAPGPAREVKGVPVGKMVKSLVFLHTCAFRFGGGSYRVNYEDGTHEQIKIKGGQNIGPWIYSIEGVKSGSRWNLHYTHGYLTWTRLILTGRTAMGEKTGLYVYEWVNPHPEKAIASVDMEIAPPTGGATRRIALVALSAVE